MTPRGAATACQHAPRPGSTNLPTRGRTYIMSNRIAAVAAATLLVLAGIAGRLIGRVSA